jgi:hypothetical protein
VLLTHIGFEEDKHLAALLEKPEVVNDILSEHLPTFPVADAGIKGRLVLVE